MREVTRQQAHPYPPCQSFSPSELSNFRSPGSKGATGARLNKGGVTARLSRSGRREKPAGTLPAANPLDHGGKREPDSSYLLLRLEGGKMDAELVTLG